MNSNHRAIFTFLAAFLVSAPALAAPKADLAVSISPPSGVHVYESGHYTVTVANVGNKSASNVNLTIALPETNTSPTVYIMGTLGGYDSRCTVSGTSLSCNLSSIAQNTSKTVYFDITMPYSTEPLDFVANATTTTLETNFSNNTANHTASLLVYSISTDPPETVVNRHCTGQGLSSFYECELFPSSISSHTTILEADGSITFVGAPPEYTGQWWQASADRLQFQYFESSVLVAEFDGRGVDGADTCWEGETTFPGSPYMSMYEVCIQ